MNTVEGFFVNDFETKKARAEELRKIIEYHNKKYYENDEPEIEDFEYDAMLRELEKLEEEYPEFRREDSPTQLVGGAALKLFAPARHEVKMESLQDVFSFDELREFDRRVRSAAENATYAATPVIILPISSHIQTLTHRSRDLPPCIRKPCPILPWWV